MTRDSSLSIDKKVIEITLDRLRNEHLKEHESLPNDNQSFAKLTVSGLNDSNWNLLKDNVIIKFNKVVEFAKKLKPTKRNGLWMAAKLFDQLGLVSPVSVVF